MRALRIASGLVLAVCGMGQVTVPMSQYNLDRTGANLQETILRPDNVNPERFGRLFWREVDDAVYALPLVVPGLEIGGQIDSRLRNVFFVVTMNNTVYAFDADDAARTAPYWQRHLGAPGDGDPWIGPVRWGTLGTPFIDLSTATMYLVAKVKSAPGAGLFLYALDIRTGELKYNSPQRLSFPFTGQVVTDVPAGIQRAGLLVTDGVLVAAFAAIYPSEVYESQEGFLQSFDAHDLSRRLGVFQVTPSGLKGGIWQAGRGIAADRAGRIYVSTAGGDYDSVRNFGSSVLRLSARTLALEDWFTPANFDELHHGNIDISANGVTLIPDTPLLFAGGKEGVIYLLERSNLGRLETAARGPVQRFQASHGCGLVDCAQTLGTAFWSRGSEGTLYVWDRRDVLRAYSFTGQRFMTTPVSTGVPRPEMTGGPSLSANGSDLASGIVWAVTVAENANSALTAATLRAFRAADVSQELYNSDVHRQRDSPGFFAKFATPVVANGKVFVVSHSNAVSVYGLLPVDPPQPAIRQVVNSADFTPRVASQSLAAIFGEDLAPGTCSAASVPLPNQMCGVSVQFADGSGNQALAPLLHVSPKQINLQIPASQFALGADGPRKQAAMTVNMCLLPSNVCAPVSVDEQAPAVFLYPRTAAVNDPILTHASGALVTPDAPAAAGETLVLYATGFGYQHPGFPRDGFAAPTDRIIELADQSAVQLEPLQSVRVDFAGLAPGLVGVAQINFTLPAQLPPGELYLYLKGAREGRSQAVRVYTSP